MALFPQSKIFSVTELNLVIKEMLEGVFPDITVRGEISGLRAAASGHMYFDLKDGDSVIPAVLFKGYNLNSGVELAEGLSVLVKAGVSCYLKQGRYQLIVKDVQPQSAGLLYLAFEKLKKQLAAEGLFAPERKKPVPAFPSKIGVVTSLHGAAVKDILSILERRGAGLEVIIAPVLVQGAGAKEDIAAAIKLFNERFPATDVLLVGRGGGSAEDLWAFNEEIVARAIAGSKIPVISCVGHETDFTIADFVADLRAPTPSAAAELVVKNRADLKESIRHLQARLLQGLRLFHGETGARLEIAASRLHAAADAGWRERMLELDRLGEKLPALAAARVEHFAWRAGNASARLAALSPQSVMKRGYSVVRSLPDGKLVTDAASVSDGGGLKINFYKGAVRCRVTGREENDG